MTDVIANVAGLASTSKAFLVKLVQVAKAIGANPSHLATVIAFETGKTFSPSIRNKAGSGATGLIQFMPSTAKRLGTTTDALAGMSAVNQMDYVYAYLKPFAGRIGNLDNLYLAIIYPNAIGRDPNDVIFSSGSTAYEQNKGLDRNGDGSITAGEITSAVKDILNAAKGVLYVEEASFLSAFMLISGVAVGTVYANKLGYLDGVKKWLGIK